MVLSATMVLLHVINLFSWAIKGHSLRNYDLTLKKIPWYPDHTGDETEKFRDNKGAESI